MQISNTLDSRAILIDAKADTKEQMLRDIANIAAATDQLAGREEDLFKAFLEREKMGSTGFGDGIAIPHCRIDGIDSFIVGLAVHKTGVDFDSLDKKPTQLLAFIIGPSEMKNDHVHLLSKISRILNTKGIVKELCSTTSAESAYETFLRHSDDDITVSLKEEEPMVLFNVMIQREDIFENIVEVFAAMNQCSASILRADDSSSYFGTVPLFKSFFADDNSFNRVILATMPKKLANETVRQIEQISGDLKKKSGVLITVQELFYCNGSLNY